MQNEIIAFPEKNNFFWLWINHLKKCCAVYIYVECPTFRAVTCRMTCQNINGHIINVILIFHNFLFSLFVLALLVIPVTSVFPPGMIDVYLIKNKMPSIIISNNHKVINIAFMQVLVMDTPTLVNHGATKTLNMNLSKI